MIKQSQAKSSTNLMSMTKKLRPHIFIDRIYSSRLGKHFGRRMGFARGNGSGWDCGRVPG